VAAFRVAEAAGGVAAGLRTGGIADRRLTIDRLLGDSAVADWANGLPHCRLTIDDWFASCPPGAHARRRRRLTASFRAAASQILRLEDGYGAADCLNQSSIVNRQ
jgi:hypothetical protein